MSTISLSDPQCSDLQLELDRIVSQHRDKLQKKGEMEPSHGEWSYKDFEEEEEVEEKFQLRSYQEELIRPALKGINVIIVAPTGSGKTHVGCRIIQEHFRLMRQKHGIGKAALLVRDVALADQHGKTCHNLLPTYRIQAVSGETKRNQGISLADCLERRDIVVMTAQLLLNSLMEGEIKSITQFSLLIFDECHHCHDDHAYNKIMQLYRDIKLTPGADTSSLPQVIGLTASVGVGKANDVAQAKRYILKLMANLDADLISTVTENLDELQQYVVMATPDPSSLHLGEEEKTIIHVKSRRNDVFRVSITLVMNEIESMMRNEEVVKNVTAPVDYISVFNAPTEKGSEQYIQWLHNMWNVTATVHDPKVRQFVYPCFKHLMWYNDALIIYIDARVKDAVDYLHEKINDWKDKPKFDNTEQCLLRLYEACMNPQTVQEVPNPKLDALKETILRSFSEKSVDNSRCIVFVKTRNLAGALAAWMTDTPELNALDPTIFVGTNATRDKGGLTKCEQGDKLADFRRGRYKIMVATSVAEEGLDIQQCNLVLRYDHVTHEIAMVQSRGRARAMDSRYCVVAQVGKGTAEKEEINVMREKLMQQAIIELQLDIQQSPQKIRQHLRELQEKDKFNCILQAKQKEERLIKQGEYELRCIQCNSFISMSSDIRKVQNSHNVVIDPSFRDRVSFTKSTEPKFQSPEIQFIGKIACSNCNEDFGTFCNYRNLELPVIKVCQFIVIGQNGEQKKYKKWKKVPFEIPQLTNEEITNLLDKLD
ncbi:hypothetical protein ACJMK2_004847 [Sinanodonta woodiana]